MDRQRSKSGSNHRGFHENSRGRGGSYGRGRSGMRSGRQNDRERNERMSKFNSFPAESSGARNH